MRQAGCNNLKMQRTLGCKVGLFAHQPNPRLPTPPAILSSKFYTMLETMYVHCAHCGYDNSPEYRFCGMCGASLAHPPVATKPVERVQAAEREASPPPANGSGHTENVHGPSFLGLAEDPKVEFHYLYEDEQPRSHVGLIVFLLLIFGAAGYLGWQWKHGAFPFNRQTASTNNASANNEGAQQSASPSEVSPAMNQDQSTHIDKPLTGGAAHPEPVPTEQTNNSNQKNQAADSTNKPAEPAASAEGSKPNTPPAASEEKTDTAEATAPEPPPAAKGKSARKASTPTPAPKAAPAKPAAPDADLELSGERFLYGTGVPQNCSRAESSLRTAALHGNSKAQTVLGTMYATGHCVGRDLPTAYRWFARALHQEPQNSRISADLQVLWRQMSPQEKQLATSSGGQ